MIEELTEKQKEILNLVQEECAEIIQIISKIRRFGFNCVFENISNGDRLRMELADLKLLLDHPAMKEVTAFDNPYVDLEYAKAKIERLKRFTTIFD